MCAVDGVAGLVFVCFGPPNTHLLFDLVYGAKWTNTSAPNALAWYCVYVLLLAVNGITESFLMAAISPRALHRYNAWLLAFSLIYIGCAMLLLPYGSVGLIAANCLNFATRILYSIVFIVAFLVRARSLEAQARLENENSTSAASSSASSSSSAFDNSSFWQRVLPAPALFFALLLASAVTWASNLLLNVSAFSLSLTSSASSPSSSSSLSIITSISTSIHKLAASTSPKLLSLLKRIHLESAVVYAAHVSVGVCMLGAVLLALLRRERAFLTAMMQLLSGRGKQKPS